MKKALLAGLLLTYPFAVYFGLQYSEPVIIGGVFVAVLLLRHWLVKDSKATIPHLKIMTACGCGLLLFATFANSALALKFYPVVISCCFLAVFAYSLYRPPSVIEIIAGKFETLDEHGKRYTRSVTKVWCVFFILNGFIATVTVIHPNPKVWLTYNGLISYLLMGLLMIIELIVRKWQKAKNKSNEVAK
ncbi:hypothetical protein [Pseudoalteromonas distincta]|uniref:COG4648 family protein n=1 Tax=Pseudoalteromonas distincta TaxID=77608 RepID=UPI00186A2A3F|nr:hypothetical protein [Pseudoalteromonas distincta]MBE3675279.1 hypothetical protein [Pseudoalteromonas distincta KMM 3548]MDC3211523.1 hypothetical protein [Pseudoalteromonas distincta]